MTDTSHHHPTINGHGFPQGPLLNGNAVGFYQHPVTAAPQPAEVVAEDDGQINCVCGYFDDDGWTVACDGCNQWQHQLCYYPDFEDRSLPEDLSHYCIDCRPRNGIDIGYARNRQTRRREEQRALVNSVKRQPSKSHKKKVKDVPYTNGWPLDKSRHDRNSASPRDQPPPAKRPKTSHRTSDSTSKGHARKRTATTGNQRSQSRSPDASHNFYSDEFIRCYRDDTWSGTDANLYDSIAIANKMSTWLTAPEEELPPTTQGQNSVDLFMRYGGDLSAMAPSLEIIEDRDDNFQDDGNNVPTWKTVMLKDSSVSEKAFLGELKGHVGFKDEYLQDPSNRWSLLRHPEPFVFFHPRLPIYIDARNEGTELRYIRRSCRPNAKLQVIVTGGTTYHFCFVATTHIDPGTEIAINWDPSDSLPEQILQGEDLSLPKEDMRQLYGWVSTVLANCGPCACNSSDCLLTQLDRRGKGLGDEDEAESTVKMPRSKRRKTGQQISPINTTFNSRSGSEAHKLEPDDEQSESRSASGSGGRESASRDITPNTHYSHTGSLSTAPELSERERRKVAKEEEMFARQAEAQTGRTSKKKRHSGGSTVNTPSATSSKHFSYPGSSKYTDASTSKQTGLPAAKAGRKPKSMDAHKTPGTANHKPKVLRPVAHAEVQCDMDKEEAEERARTAPQRMPYIPMTQRLLQRYAMYNARRREPAVLAKHLSFTKTHDQMEIDRRALSSPPDSERGSRTPELEHVPSGPRDAEHVEHADDCEMKDVVPISPPSDQPHVDEIGSESRPTPPVSPEEPSHLPREPIAPPWPSQAAHLAPVSASSPPINNRPPDMHLQMPPPSANPFAHAPPLSASSPTRPGLVTGFTQSPAALITPSLFSPSVTAAVTPSPAKKKMSLSDYTKRISRAKDKEVEARHERDSSPASVASGPVVPPLQASESMKERAGSAAVEDCDVRMEDTSAAHGL
ncbi:SET domain-containing protein 3 [Extremus antarcticus]|uniref:SET domain-containing protein 3 n=1 Tax=Extremus antarcticus TaxID=702011 RepID=A0AAJ0DC95_9PEZI|nr:SET domain-containing protein 3 [Extremus antarcticus]